MGDLSEYFKRGFQDLKKQAIERNYAQKTLKVRMEEFNQARRQTRSSLMFQKRKIDEKNVTPYNTPESEKPTKKLIKLQETLEHKSNKRLEMLHKWKAARAKKKEEEKMKLKPVFKVYHIPVNVGLPNLETVNKEIKGKLINTSKFAPENHVFKPPVNVKPIHFQNETIKLKNNALDSTRKNKKDINIQVKPNLVSNSLLLKRSGRVKVESTKLESNKLEGTKEAAVGGLENNKAFERGSKKTLEKQSKKRGYIDQDVQKLSERKEKPLKSSRKSQKTQFPSFAEKRGSTSTNRKEKLDANKLGAKEINRKETTNVRILRSHEDITSNNDKDKNTELLNSSRKTGNKKNRGKVPLNEVSSVNTTTSLKSNSTPQKTRTPSSAKKQGPASTNHKGNFDTNKIQNKSSSKVVHQKETTNIRVLRSHKDPTSTHDKDKNIELLNSSCKTPKKRNKGKSLLNEVSSANQTKQNVDILYSDEEITLKTPRMTPIKTPLKVFKKTPLKEQTPENIITNIPKSNSTESVSSSKIYISPFVTVSRGKESARKEYRIRQSTGGSLPDTPDFGKFVSKATSPNAGADYFSNKLDNEIDRIQQLCDDWLHYKEADVPEDVKDLIDVAIGQSKLLMAKKFCQFKNLIAECRDYTNKERPVTCMDLHGFWDTMYMQVEDINKRFDNLEVLKANNWQVFILENKSKAKNIKNRPARQTKAKASSKIKDMIKLARARKEKEVSDCDNIEFEKSEILEIASDVPNRRSTRLSILQTEQVKKRLSSPGLTMMKITQAIKQGDGITPNSILKTNPKKNEKRMTKCVLFKDLEEGNNKKVAFEIELDKENNSDDSVQFYVHCSPLVPKRQSRRLSKN